MLRGSPRPNADLWPCDEFTLLVFAMMRMMIMMMMVMMMMMN